MGQRAAGFSKKKPEVVKATFASVTASDIIRAPVPLRALPLELAPLLVPYKRQGRLSLRVEGVPQLARLSTGRNNGDGTWSLASDELEGLSFLVPEDQCKDRALTIRIMSFDGGAATTLKVLDIAVTAEGAVADSAALPLEEAATASVADDEADLAQLEGLQGELAALRAMLAQRDSELAETRRQADGARSELGRTAAELNDRLASMTAQAARDIEQLRTAWLEEQEARGKELATAQASSSGELNSRLSTAVAQAAQDLEKARKLWQAQQDARIAETEAGAARRLAEAHERLERENREALAKAQDRWKTEEAGRLAAAEAGWREQAARALAEATKLRQAAETALANAVVPARKNEIELERVRKELAAAQTALSTRESELAKQRADGEQARQQSQLDSEVALLNAKAAWKAEEAARWTGAEAEWRARTDAALADATEKRRAAELALAEACIRADAVASDGKSEAELERLRKELAAAQTLLATRESEFAKQRAESDAARQRGAADSQTVLADAKLAWKAEEAAHLAAAEAQWREKSETALAQAATRFEAAEAALAQARSANAGKARASDDGYVDRLRGELTALQNVLVGREAELAHARSAIEQLRGQYWPEARTTRAGGWELGGPEEETFRRANLRLVRDVIVVVSLVMSLVLFWPRVVMFIPDSWKANIFGLTSSFGLAAEDAPAPAAAPPAPAPAAAKPEMALVARAVNMRAAPSQTAEIVAKLTRNAEVTVLERQGAWTRVGIAGVKPLEGWVFNNFLKSESDAAAAPPAAAPVAAVRTVPVAKPAPHVARGPAETEAPAPETPAAAAPEAVSEAAAPAAPPPAPAPVAAPNPQQ